MNPVSKYSDDIAASLVAAFSDHGASLLQFLQGQNVAFRSLDREFLEVLHTLHQPPDGESSDLEYVEGFVSEDKDRTIVYLKGFPRISFYVRNEPQEDDYDEDDEDAPDLNDSGTWDRTLHSRLDCYEDAYAYRGQIKQSSSYVPDHAGSDTASEWFDRLYTSRDLVEAFLSLDSTATPEDAYLLIRRTVAEQLKDEDWFKEILPCAGAIGCAVANLIEFSNEDALSFVAPILLITQTLWPVFPEDSITVTQIGEGLLTIARCLQGMVGIARDFADLVKVEYYLGTTHFERLFCGTWYATAQACKDHLDGSRVIRGLGPWLVMVPKRFLYLSRKLLAQAKQVRSQSVTELLDVDSIIEQLTQLHRRMVELCHSPVLRPMVESPPILLTVDRSALNSTITDRYSHRRCLSACYVHPCGDTNFWQLYGAVPNAYEDLVCCLGGITVVPGQTDPLTLVATFLSGHSNFDLSFPYDMVYSRIMHHFFALVSPDSPEDFVGWLDEGLSVVGGELHHENQFCSSTKRSVLELGIRPMSVSSFGAGKGDTLIPVDPQSDAFVHHVFGKTRFTDVEWVHLLVPTDDPQGGGAEDDGPREGEGETATGYILTDRLGKDWFVGLDGLRLIGQLPANAILSPLS